MGESCAQLSSVRSWVISFPSQANCDTRSVNARSGGRVVLDGALWVGSMDERQDKEPIACFYRVDASGRAEVVGIGFQVANGLAWDAAGATMYFPDFRDPWVDAFDFDPTTGRTSRRRRFATLTTETGRADGAACDTEDCYWSAGPSANRLNLFSPQCELLTSSDMPNFRPTMPCFGGPGPGSALCDQPDPGSCDRANPTASTGRHGNDPQCRGKGANDASLSGLVWCAIDSSSDEPMGDPLE